MTATNVFLPREVVERVEGLTAIEALHLNAAIAMFLAERLDGNSCALLADFEAGVFPLETTSDVQIILEGLDSLFEGKTTAEAERVLVSVMHWQTQTLKEVHLRGNRQL